MTDLTTEQVAERCSREPGQASTLPDRAERQPTDPPSPGGVRLARLLGLARLTPAQVLEIGAGLLMEAARLTARGTDAPADGRAMIDQIMIGTDGRVVLGPTSHREHNGRPSSAARPSLTDVEAVLVDLATAGRAGRADPATEQLPAELDRAVTLLPVAGVSEVAQMLGAACGAFDRAAVRAELAALVRAVVEIPESARGGEPAGGPYRVLDVDHGRRSTSGGTRAVVRRTGAWVLSVLVLVAVVLLEVALLRDDIVADVNLLLDAGRAGSGSSTPPPEADGLPVPPFAPAVAGIVTAVDLRLLEPCAPGAPCTVRILVRLVPGPDSQTVTWSYRVVDRCTGAIDSAPGGSVAVPPGSDQTVTVDVVALPPVPAVAVVAVTDRPAVAAAQPVLVGSCDPDLQSD